MHDPFLLRAKHLGTSAEDIALLAETCGTRYDVQARTDILAAGSPSGAVHVLVEGWACKYRLMADGRRQIVSFQLAGEICDLDRLIDNSPSVGVTALADCKVATLGVDWLTEARRCRPGIREWLWQLLTREHAAMTEQIVALGRRTSRQRVAYLLCDLLERLQALGMADKGSFRTPLTQSDIADALGLSTVHVNRTLQGLREDGLIEMRGRTLRVPSQAALERAASYERGGDTAEPARPALAFSARSR